MRHTRTINDQRPVRRILVADDDAYIARLVREALVAPTYEVTTVSNGLEAIQQFRKGAYDLVILDVMMPFVDGFETCQRIREASNVPIVMLTARGGTDDIVHGFELGADDYITKPFTLDVLVARVEAILRRVAGQAQRQAPPTLQAGDLFIDKPRHAVSLNDKPVALTPMEFELLYFLAANRGQVFDRETLFREVWGYEYVGETNLVDVCVRRLREKIEVEPSKPRRILTVRGIGYKLGEE